MNKEEAINLSIVKMIAYYNFNGEIEGGGVHPRVRELESFLKKHINTGPDLEDFLRKIKENCKFFPTLNDLSTIFNGMRPLNQVDVGINLLQYQNREHISPLPKEEFKNATVDDVIAADATMSTKSLLECYGTNLCTRAWHTIGQKMTDSEYEKFIFHARRREYDAAFNVTRFERKKAKEAGATKHE